MKSSVFFTTVMALFITTTLFHPSSQQLNINVQIEPDSANMTLEGNSLSAELTRANISQGYIQSVTQEELMVDICTKGTFSSPTGGLCVDCPVGTASPVEGASNDMTCGGCSAGTFAAAASSACTDCPVNTFSTQYKASSAAQCITCPTDTTSSPGSDNVRSCVCNNGFFVSNNLVSGFDGVVAALGFDGAASINLPHVVCSV
jgi:hypothetical protein